PVGAEARVRKFRPGGYFPGAPGARRMRGMRSVLALSFLCGILGVTLCAAAPVPIYHGILSVRRAGGTLDRTTYTASIKVPEWTALLTPDTDGMFPATEDVMVSIGTNDDFTLP